MIFKKKEIIAASLVVLIGMAGYLNWSYQDTVKVKDNDSYIETGKTLGEAEMVLSNNEVTEEPTAAADNGSASDDGDTDAEKVSADAEGEQSESEPKAAATFDEAKMNRESARASAMEILKATSADETVDEQTRKAAGEKLIENAENIELESTIENVAAAKGFPDLCAYINSDTVTLTVKSDGLSDEDAAKLRDIATANTSVTADKVRVIEVK